MKICRLITVDIMGTLMDINKPVGVSYSEMGARYGLNIPPHILNKNFKKAWNDMKVRHPNYGLYTGIGWEKWWRMLVHETFINSSNKVLSSKILNTVSDKLIHGYSNADKWKCCDGALEFMNHCHSKNVPLAVLSNFDKRLEDLLEGMHIRKYFRFVVTSYTVGFEKPDQRIFNITENIAKNFDDLQDIKKSDILHIGDMPEYDYIPAKTAGWCAYLVSNNPNEILQKFPNVSKKDIFKDFHEIKQVLE